MSFALPIMIVLSFAAPNDESFSSAVRTTEPLAPQEQQKSFRLPEGFEIQLVASEPELQKPMNMSFDGAGRLWVTGSVEYPYAAAENAGRDTIKVLEDTNGDGSADKITTFVDGLNIPMGLYPFRDGVVAYSIPHIWFFRDTDGDGRADRREILYGNLGTPRDTHGMQNAFRRGFDGWLYINHGFSNESTVTGKDGSSITLQSGNTYRVRLDGSHVEQFTWGQVNPFGSAFLPTGDLITADCHSRPLTLLLRGAYYPSFGKPHDGLGFAPDLMEHSHGSTAIGGVAYYTGDNFPPKYHGHLFAGNVMTSRINHDVLEYSGSTPRAVELPDFLSSDDPWFRPVDLQVGPDGALYIADFYNRIIGHYEVSLDHPGRDKHRARIWRVVYRGKGSATPLAAPNLTRHKTSELIESLGHSSLIRRMLATDQLSDRMGEAAEPELTEALALHPSETVRLHSLWVLHRLGKLTDRMIDRACRDPSELVRIHAMRAMAESGLGKFDLQAAIRDESNPQVRRAAAEAIGQSTGHDVGELLNQLSHVPAEDPLLRHTLRLAIRNQLRGPEAWNHLHTTELNHEQRTELAGIAVAIADQRAASFLIEFIRDRDIVTDQIEAQLNHLCTHLPADKLPDLVNIVREKAKGNVDLQLKILLRMHQRAEQRSLGDRSSLRAWGAELAASLLDDSHAPEQEWQNQSPENPWGLETRSCENGKTGVMFLSSLPGGETQTAVLKSRTFVIPPRLTFYLCGHLGLPNQAAIERNFVQLRLAESGDVIQRSLPPRNDTAKLVQWELSKYAGQHGFLEVVDGLNLTGYAWLGVAGFDPPVVSVPVVAPAKRAEHKVAACAIVAALKLDPLRPEMLSLVGDRSSEWPIRAAAAQSALAFSNRPLLSAVSTMISEPSLDARLREAICQQIGTQTTDDAPAKLLSDVMKASSARVQRQLSDALASTPIGAETLVALVEQGHAAARLLQDRVIHQKIAAHSASLNDRMERLTASLPPPGDQIQRLIDERRKAYRESSVEIARGQELFRKHCAVCHQVAGQGAVVGPQLDGIGNRGLDRLIEDTLDPNRNVDVTFHVSVMSLANGQVVPGLFRCEEGASLVFANQEGKEFMLLKADIEEQTKSNTSLMPANVGELLKPDEFRDLIGYLLTLRGSGG